MLDYSLAKHNDQHRVALLANDVIWLLALHLAHRYGSCMNVPLSKKVSLIKC